MVCSTARRILAEPAPEARRVEYHQIEVGRNRGQPCVEGAAHRGIYPENTRVSRLVGCGACAALAGGGTETTMKNQNGVVIKMHATNAGVDLRLSIDGVSVKVSQ
jgi:hypothetical protein